MTRVSRRKIDEEFYKKLDDQFTFLIGTLTKPSDIRLFFNDFLTTEEKTMLTKRLMLYFMLQQGYSVQDIKTALGMSRETVRVHKMAWNRVTEGFKQVFKKLSRREQMNDFWKAIDRKLKPLELMLKSKSDIRARAKLLFGDGIYD